MGFRARITLLTTVLVIAVTGLTLLSVLQLTKSVIRREMGNQLLTLVTTTALMIDAEQHTALTSLGDIQSPIYRDIKGTILRQLRANPQTHVKYLYTMVRGNRPGVYRFVVDSDETRGARMGEEYDANLHPEMLDAFNGPMAEQEFQRDKWGKTLSAYAPIRDRTGIPVAIVGADATVEGLDAMHQGLVWGLTLSLVIGLLLAFGAGIYSGRVLARPLSEVLSGTETVTRGDLDYRFSVLEPTEFGQLSEALNKMILGLRERDSMRVSLTTLAEEARGRQQPTDPTLERIHELATNLGDSALPIGPEYREDAAESIRELRRCFQEQCYLSTLVMAGRLLEVCLRQRCRDASVVTQDDWSVGTLMKRLDEQGLSPDPTLHNVANVINRFRIVSAHARGEVYPSEDQVRMVIHAAVDLLVKTFLRRAR
jgi:hypothetical protein